MYLIDTCIFLEILLDQVKAESCIEVIEKIRSGKIKGYITSFTLHSIAVILSRFKKLDALDEFLKDILTLTNLEIVYTDIVDELKVVQIMNDLNLDFDDCIQYYIAKRKSIKIVSLDKDFDKTDIVRVDPQNVM